MPFPGRYVRPNEYDDPWWDTIQAYLDNVEEDVSAFEAGHDLSANGAHKFAVVVTEYGADPSGDNDAAAAINAAIANSPAGAAILFPGGTYLIETPVLLKADRAYLGMGSVVLKQKAATELDAIVMMDPAEAYPRRSILWMGVHLDGNAVNPATGAQTNNTVYQAGSGYLKNRGMVLDSVQFSNFIDLAIRACGNDALTVTGSSSWDFSQQGSTNHFVSPYIYGNGGRGVVFGPMADDNHIYDGDIGDQNYEGVHFSGGSSSLRACTVWGSRYANGIVVGAPSNQIIGCQVEGHAQHGIAVLTRYANWTLIANCKIYDNSIQASGGYDGIYVQGDPGYVNTVGADASGLAPATPAAIQFYPPAAGYDFSGASALTFTIADGTTTQTVTLNAAYGHLAAVVTAVDGQLDASYVVTASGGYVRIAAAVAGNKTLTVGGTDAGRITGAAGYPVSYTTILGNFIYAGIGDFYLDTGHNVDPAGGGGYTDSDGVFHPGTGWNGQRHGITLDDEHQYAVVSGNNAGLIAPGAGAVNNGTQPVEELLHGGPSTALVSVAGLKAGDEYNGVAWSTQAEEDARYAASPRTWVPGAVWWREDTGQLKLYTGPSRDRIERVLTSHYDTEGGTFTSNGTGSQDVSIPARFDTAYTITISPSWATTWWVDGKTLTQFTVHFATPPAAGTACDYTLMRHSG